MNAQAKLIRFWAMRHPRPASFLVYSGNEKSTVELGPRISWARVAESLDAMEPDRIDALSVNGNVIRSCKPAELDQDEDTEAEDDEERSADALKPIAAFDGETARFQMYSQQIAAAYKDAQAQVGLRNDAVFNRMIDLFETLAQQSKDQSHALNVQQATITKLYEQQIKDAFERAQTGGGSGESSWIDDLVRPLVEAMQNQAGGADEPDEPEPAPAATNGKGPH